MSADPKLIDKTALSSRRSRRRRYYEVPDVAACARRLALAVGKRIADGDPEDLAELVALAESVEDAMVVAVAGLRESGRSDGDIGRVLGVSKQAVAQRFPRSAS